MLGVWWVAHSLIGGVGRITFDIALPYILADPAVDLPEMIKVGTVTTIAGGPRQNFKLPPPKLT